MPPAKAARKNARKRPSGASPPDSAPPTQPEEQTGAQTGAQAPPAGDGQAKDGETVVFLIDLPHIREQAASRWPNSWQGLYLMALMLAGDHAQACREAKTDPAYVAAERDRDAEFSRLVQIIEDVRPQLVEASLFQLAQQGTRVEYYRDGTLSRVEYRRDVRAIQLFLQAHHPKYGEVVDNATPKNQRDATSRALKGTALADWLSKQAKKTAD